MERLENGASLGPYRILHPIGEGGMARVYKAFQANMERYVALKVLPSHYAEEPQFVKRFIREARTIARIVPLTNSALIFYPDGPSSRHRNFYTYTLYI